jgi:hypothetical protein
MYLDHMLEQMPSERDALAAYYTGPGNVRSKLTPGQRAYADDVKDLETRY